MVEPGLTSRLRQHSRRSGMMVGLSMVIVIAICITVFIWLYLRVGPLLSDFIPAEAAATPTPVRQAQVSTPVALAPSPTPTERPSATPTAAASASPTAIWQATHVINDGPAINFRAGPSTVQEIVDVLEAGTQLKFLGEQQPGGGSITWMRFQTRDGTIGWIRSIDVRQITP